MSDPCFAGWTKKDGNINGHCCCTCKYQRPIVCHPWNKHILTKGRITSIIGYGCNAPEMSATVFFDSKHGMCEMYSDRNNVVKLELVK